MPKYALVKSAEEAEIEAGKVGFPLVAKIVSPEILHKTDVRGVKVGLQNQADVKVYIQRHVRQAEQAVPRKGRAG